METLISGKYIFAVIFFSMLIGAGNLHAEDSQVEKEKTEKGYFGKNPADYEKPFEYLSQEIDKEKGRLAELQEKEAARVERVKSAEKDIQEKNAKVSYSGLKGLSDYAKGDKAGAVENYLKGVKAYVETKDRELQAIKDATSSFKPEIRQSQKRIRLLEEIKKVVEDGKSKAQEIQAKEKADKARKAIEEKAKAEREARERVARERAANEKAAQEKKAREAAEQAERERKTERDRQERHEREIREIRQKPIHERTPREIDRDQYEFREREERDRTG